MKINNQFFLNLFLVVALLHVYTIVSGNENYIVLTKYLLVPMLLLHVIVNCRKALMDALPLILGLFFCWAGDAFLLYTDKNENYFMFGLAAFLIGHLFYILSFRKYSYKGTGILRKKPWLLIFPLLYTIFLLLLVFPYLEEMKIPVIIYAAAITGMCMAAINRFDRTNFYGFLFVFVGALFFVVSDSMIAINKFYTEIQSASLLIMSTYIIAQYLITAGLLLHINKPNTD